MRGKRASGTKHSRNGLQNIKSSLTSENFHSKFRAFFVFPGTASSCIFKISDSETLAKREFTPAILFLFGLRNIHSAGGWIINNYSPSSGGG